MTIYSPDTLLTGPGHLESGQASGAISPVPDMVDLVESLAGIYAPTPKTTTPYVLDLPDRGTCIEMNLAGANVVTIPTNAVHPFGVGTVIEVYQMGAGQTTVSGAGVTIRTPTGTATIRAQYSSVSLRKRATDEWVLSGDLT